MRYKLPVATQQYEFERYFVDLRNSVIFFQNFVFSAISISYPSCTCKISKSDQFKLQITNKYASSNYSDNSGGLQQSMSSLSRIGIFLKFFSAFFHCARMRTRAGSVGRVDGCAFL